MEDNKELNNNRDEVKPNDAVTMVTTDFIKITDIDTGEELISKRG